MFINDDFISAMEEINNTILEEPIPLDLPIGEIKGYLMDCAELITEEDNISPKARKVILSLFQEAEKIEGGKIEEREKEIEEEEDEEEDIKEEITIVKENKIDTRTNEEEEEGEEKGEEGEGEEVIGKETSEEDKTPKRGRGRPKLLKVEDKTEVEEKPKRGRGRPKLLKVEDKTEVEDDEILDEAEDKETIGVTKSLEEKKDFVRRKFPTINESLDASVVELEEMVENFVAEFREGILFIKDTILQEVYNICKQNKPKKLSQPYKREPKYEKKKVTKKLPSEKRGVGEFLENIISEGPLQIDETADIMVDKFKYETCDEAKLAIRRHLWRLKDEGIKVSYNSEIGEYNIEN